LSSWPGNGFLAAMGPSQASLAVILRSRPYGESDKIVTFLGADVGKLTGIAKGAKNSRRRFANCLDPFTRVRMHFRARPGANLAFLESCDLLEPVGALVEPTKFAYASYLVELVDQLTAEAQPVGELYELLANALHELRHGPATGAFLRYFELRLLQHTGYAPDLQACTRCRVATSNAEQLFLDVAHGTILCPACRSQANTIAVAGEVVATLRAIETLPLADARRHRLPARAAVEAANLMGQLLAVHLPRPLRSVKLIAALS
jgi:DNA repair protein RecO (recombination protein O)